MKRTVNVFLLLWRLAEARVGRLQGWIRPIRLAKVVALQHVEPDLYEILRETPRLLRSLEEHFASELGGGEERKPAEPPPALAPFVGKSAVRRLFAVSKPDSPESGFAGLSPEDLNLYFTLTRRAEAPVPEAQQRAFFEPEMVRIPAGPFLMGSTDEQVAKGEAESDEKPQSTVELREYWIGKYPVTNAEYQPFVQETGHPSPRGWEGANYPEGKGGHPVTDISWNDCMEYCRWLSEKTKKSYGLPSEAEWEKAARGTDGRIYPWGDEFDPKKVNSREGGPGGTTPVGQYSLAGDSPYGIADAAGNVWEWTRSLHKVYPYDPEDGRESMDSEGPRVLRGGACYDDASYVRCAVRGGYFPIDRGWVIGFRVVLLPFSSDL